MAAGYAGSGRFTYVRGASDEFEIQGAFNAAKTSTWPTTFGTGQLMKYAVILLVLTGCVPPESHPTYNLTTEEVAYMVGCIEMGKANHDMNTVAKCADMSFQFLQRHRRPGK